MLAGDVGLDLDFGLGLGARGSYGTIFIGYEGANKEVLQEEAILMWQSGDFSGHKKFERSSSLSGLSVALYVAVGTAAQE